MTLAALQADFGRWLRSECTDAAARLGSGPGLDIYLNNYRSQLVSALEGSFPQLRRWLGETAFLAAAAHHIEMSPPQSWTLDAYGADFATTLATLFPTDPECAELAHIEWGLAAAFTLADVEPVAADTLGLVNWETARIRFVPGLRTIPVSTNAAALWQALAGEISPPPVERIPHSAVILLWRQAFHPTFRSVEQAEADAIRKLRVGVRFGALCDALAAIHGADDGSAIAGGWLGGWLRDGLIAGIG